MLADKKMGSVIALLVALAVIASLLLVWVAQNRTEYEQPEYVATLFGGEVVQIALEVDPADWQDFLDNATAKEYLSAAVTIDGERINNVGVRTKGNSSLTQVANSDSDRYSLNLKFNHYVKGQTFNGLDTLALNNMVGDATYMKDYMTFEMMRYMGVNAPLVNYANVTVNGEHYGLCMLIERYDKAYLGRAYNTSGGQLYNVKMTMGGANRGEGAGENNAPENTAPVRGDNAGIGDGAPTSAADMADDMRPPSGQREENGSLTPESREATEGNTVWQAGERSPNNTQRSPEGTPPTQGGFGENNAEFNRNQVDTPQSTTSSIAGEVQQGEIPSMQAPQVNGEQGQVGRGNMGMGGGMRGGGGGDLIYVDDNTTSYPSIFENATFSPKEADTNKILAAIKALNSGEDIEKYWNVDQVLRYFAVHNTVVNLDSYSSGMAQNYYLYERDGLIEVLAWDYNYGFGAFQSGSASAAINFPIDTPVSGVQMSERPLISRLLENEAYSALYHSYLEELAVDYIGGGLYAAKIDEIYAEIADHLETDSTAFYTPAQVEKAVAALKEFGQLRAQSILWQIDGSVSSTTEGQSANPELLTPVGSFSLADMGTMGGGGGQNRENNFGENGRPEGDGNAQSTQTVRFNFETMESALTIVGDTSVTDLTDEQREELLQLGITPELLEEVLQRTNGQAGGFPGGNFEGGRGGMGGGFSRPGAVQVPVAIDKMELTVVGVVLLVGFAFLIVYGRKKQKF